MGERSETAFLEPADQMMLSLQLVTAKVGDTQALAQEVTTCELIISESCQNKVLPPPPPGAHVLLATAQGCRPGASL